ncbi:hypothetical protein QYM36_014274 [Artemia franciscana]|uniref:MARVEL domain-containing protein n=1 Tax=Artemia franciscana TaxID=6661 RepID=A0AA88HN85_ARTSF|nr:hypothetical protein QYM36_014274 [Artemia franciscana]
MGDAGVTQIPKANQPHLTTVTIKNDPTIQPAGPVVVLNVNYISSWHGLLKGLQLLFAIICMACASPATHPGTSWFLCVVVITFIFTLLWLSFHFPVHGNTFSCTKCELVKGENGQTKQHMPRAAQEVTIWHNQLRMVKTVPCGAFRCIQGGRVWTFP